jgi:mannose-6-phosphate isomerase-like protein (cupin superfamily)
MENVIVRHVDNVSPVPCPCGQSTRVITHKDTPKLNIHRTEIKDSEKHYHKKTTEVYYITKGSGTMELDGKPFDLTPGLVIYIPQNVRHQVFGTITAIIVGVPAFHENDEYFD